MLHYTFAIRSGHRHPRPIPRDARGSYVTQGQHPLVKNLLHSSAGNTPLQTKLKIGAPNDRFEQEADRVAEQVMAMPEPNVVSDLTQDRESSRPPPIQGLYEAWQGELQRQPIDEEEEELVQTKPDGCGVPVLSPEAGALIRSGNGRGQPLPVTERSFFERRLGADFSNVRIHNDARAANMARLVNARAFTHGNHIVFGAGEYAANTRSGRKLLAHELTHVLQQHAGAVDSPSSESRQSNSAQSTEVQIQRKIQVNPGVSLDGYLVSNATKSGNVYTHSGACQASIEDQIMTDMLYSPRSFHVKGRDNLTAGLNLGDHVAARKGIIDFAAKKRYKFAAGAAMTMNPKYWESTSSDWQVKSGADFMTAMKDVNVSPDKYEIACEAATKITMLAGSGDFLLKKDTGVANNDWVPGDWGYIKNTKFVSGTSKVGLEGENIIYTGNGKFWGHFTGNNTYRTLQEWIDEVNSWNTPAGGASLKGYRKRPSKGLY